MDSPVVSHTRLGLQVGWHKVVLQSTMVHKVDLQSSKMYKVDLQSTKVDLQSTNLQCPR